MFANLHATVKDPILSTGSPNVFFMSETGTQTGFVVGGGGEYALNGGWSVKAEYQYFDLGTTRVSGPSLAVTVPQDEFAYDIHNRGSIIRVGLNKKF